MTTEIISDISFNDPLNLIPFTELDEAIYGLRSQCLGMVDFSNTDSYAGSGVVAAGTLAKSLTSEQGVATADTAWGAVVGGMVSCSGIGNRWTLPPGFKLVAGVKRFLYILWVKIPGALGASSIYSLGGCMGNNSNNCQYGFQLQTSAGGVPNALLVNAPANGSVGSSPIILSTGAALASICNGALHQLAIEFDGSTGAACTVRLLSDKMSTVSATNAWDNSAINQPAQLPHLGYPGVSYSANMPAGMSLGRTSLWNLTGTTISASDVLVRDWDAAQGYLA